MCRLGTLCSRVSYFSDVLTESFYVYVIFVVIVSWSAKYLSVCPPAYQRVCLLVRLSLCLPQVIYVYVLIYLHI